MVWVVCSTLLIILDDVGFRNVVIDVVCLDPIQGFVLLKPFNDILISDNLWIFDELSVVTIDVKTMFIPFPNKLFLS